MSANNLLKTVLQTPGPLPTYPSLSHATVRDFCDSADRLKPLATHQQDLKDVQRPWAVKAILSSLPPPATLLEVGSGEPLAASFLADLGYAVTICDPFDGSGRGPTELAHYKSVYRNVTYLQSHFTPDIAQRYAAQPLDVIFSISVLEHIWEPALASVFDAIKIALRPGGFSIHCIDIVLEGKDDAWHKQQLERILIYQEQIAQTGQSHAQIAASARALLDNCQADIETFFLSAHGHNLWRGALKYEDFPFRKVVSVQSIIQKK